MSSNNRYFVSLLAVTPQLEESLPSRAVELNPALTIHRRYLPEARRPQTATKQLKQITVTGIVVALGGRVVRDDDACRQLMVVRTTVKGNGNLKDKYLLVPRNYDCNDGDFTNEKFENKRRWWFPLIPGADCSVTFEQIKNMPVVHPPGVFRSVRWMKLVPGNDGEKLALTE